jgi:hypothetical protein
LDLPYPAAPRGAIADWEEESLLRLRAPTCLELPTHGALSQFGFFVWVLLPNKRNPNCDSAPWVRSLFRARRRSFEFGSLRSSQQCNIPRTTPIPEVREPSQECGMCDIAVARSRVSLHRTLEPTCFRSPRVGSENQQAQKEIVGGRDAAHIGVLLVRVLSVHGLQAGGRLAVQLVDVAHARL